MNDDGLPGRDTALRICSAIRRVVWRIFHWGIIGSFALGFLGLWIQPEVGFLVAINGMLLAFLLILILSLFRVAVVLIYFARYSMRQIFYFVTGTGALLTLATTLPIEFRAIPIMTLLGGIFFLLYRISEMDPTGDNLQPAFFLEAVEEQEKRREAERLKALSDQQPGPRDEN
jgi:hypothetical protein